MVLALLARALNSTPSRLSVSDSIGQKLSKLSKPERVIVITTFSKRFEIYCLPLIKNLRQGGVRDTVYVVINGDWDGQFDTENRSRFISELANIDNCYPISLGSHQGMAQMWNAGLRLSDSEYALVLNDDTNVIAATVAEDLNLAFAMARDHDLVILNGSFGHFVISRRCIRNIGWFDERFLGFGQEDGDYYWRFEFFYQKAPGKINGLIGISNASSDIGYESLVPGSTGKYSLFNDVFLNFKYLIGSGSHAGMFGQVASKVLDEPSLAGVEHWKEDLSELVLESNPDVIKEAISRHLSRARGA